MRAFISDVHANLEALCAVMEDIEQHDVQEIICLGDIVGYGPDPETCIDRIMEKVEITLMGNHDYALIHNPDNFNPMAAELIYLTQEMMDPRKHQDDRGADICESHVCNCVHEGEVPHCLLLRQSKDSRWKFIEGLPERHQEDGILCIHGSPLDPIFEYLMPERLISGRKAQQILPQFAGFEGFAFNGHTHLPCAITDDLACIFPSDCGCRLMFDPSKKYIVNVGSVGQPRDGDNRACYLLLDDEARSVEWRRVSYDIQTTICKLNKMCGNGNQCGPRLLVGR